MKVRRHDTATRFWILPQSAAPKCLAAFAFAVVIGFNAPAASSQAPLESQTPVLRVQVDLQSLAIRVTDKQGNDVKGLSAADFTVFEDGHPQKISFFGADNVPTSLNVLVDESGSMDTGRLGSAEAIAARFLRSGRPDDEISAMEFTDQMGPFRLLTEQQIRSAAPAAVSLGASKGSALFDAVASVLCHLNTSKNLRQAIVVITDGVDQHSRLSLEQVISLVQSSRAQLFMIGSNSRPEYNLNGHPEKKLTLVSGHDIDNPAIVFDRLTSESGAASFFPNSEDGLEQALKQVSDLLQAQYTVAYYPEGNVKKFRRIQVKVKRPGVVVTVRHGVGSPIPASTSADFTDATCEVSPKAHPFPYESRVIHGKEGTAYHDDFSDTRSGWPVNSDSRYITSGYELSNEAPSKVDTMQRSSPFLGGFSITAQHNVVAAYGPWWSDFHASAVLDEVFSKGSAFPSTIDPNSSDEERATAGFVFRLNGMGYYDLLLTDARGGKDLWFKVEKREYANNHSLEIVAWTPVHLSEAPGSGMKIAVDCVGSQITIFLNGQQVGRAKDDSYDQGYVGFILSGMGRATFRDLLVSQK
jgi:Ca-activated chloride channel homolog